MSPAPSDTALQRVLSIRENGYRMGGCDFLSRNSKNFRKISKNFEIFWTSGSRLDETRRLDDTRRLDETRRQHETRRLDEAV